MTLAAPAEFVVTRVTVISGADIAETVAVILRVHVQFVSFQILRVAS